MGGLAPEPMSGKGDNRRPAAVDRKEFGQRWEQTFRPWAGIDAEVERAKANVACLCYSNGRRSVIADDCPIHGEGSIDLHFARQRRVR